MLEQHRKAAAFIQNHVNWCWATSAKIVGIVYLWRKFGDHCFSQALFNTAQGVVVRKDYQGLRLHVCGEYQGNVVVDAIQQDIVEHAKDPLTNFDGNQPEGDAGKARALRYIITGDPNSVFPEIVLVGSYLDAQDLLTSSESLIREAIELGCPFIGNYQRQDGTFHSVVLLPTSDSQLELYDPWDGFREKFSETQIFKSGFLTNQGVGRIRWIQFIRPE